MLPQQMLAVSFGTGPGKKRVEVRLKWISGYQSKGKNPSS
jgi:hypothetical protein